MVSITFILLFFFSITYIFWGLFIFFKNTKSLINRMFFSLCIQLSLWSLGYAFMTVAPTAENANVWRLIACFGWCFFYGVWVDFTILLRKENYRWMTDYRRLLFYLPAILFYILNLMVDPNEIMVKSNGIWVDRYPQDFLGFLFFIYCIFCMSVGEFIIYKWGKESTSKREKRQSQIIIISSLIAFIIGTFMDSILPMFGINISSFDILAFLVVLPSVWYAITKYKMMYITVEVANEYILKTMNEPVIIIGQDLLVKDANEAALKKTGYRATEILGSPITELLFEINNRPISVHNVFIGDISNHEIILLKKNHESIPCLLSGAPILDGFKEVMGTVCVLYDITDRKNAEKLLLNSHAELEKMVHERTSELENMNALLEEEISERQKIQDNLKASEEQYKSLIDQYQDGILVCDGSTYIITHNIKSCQILGLPEEMFENVTLKSILTPEYIYLYDEIQLVYATQRELSNIVNFTGIDGYERNIEYVFIPVSSNNQKYIMITFRDITEMMKIEEQKRQMVNMESLGTLAGGIAHDFNNILAGIIGYTQLSLDELDNGCIPRENLMDVLSLGERARKLIRQILSFSRKSNIKLERVELIPVIEEVVTMLSATKPSNVLIRYSIFCESPYALADSTELQELVMNLCVNSILALKEKGGTLNIQIEKVNNPVNERNNTMKLGEFIKINVIDNGCGIDPAFQQRIFEPFFTTRVGEGGTGLGLSVVHGIAQRYGGWIEVESELGKGSTFTVFLPSVKNVVIIQEETKEEISKLTNTRILLVDDEIPILDSVKRILENRGLKVTSISNPIEALDLFKQNTEAFDVVITDQSMPEMSGNELISKLQAVRQDMPVILCSGYYTEDEASLDNGLRKIVILSKPASKDDYIKAIESALSEEKQA